MIPILGLMIPILSIVVVCIVLIIAIMGQHKERMAMIEKGIDAPQFSQKVKSNQQQVAKWGMLLVGVAVGQFVGGIMARYTVIAEPVAMFSMTFLFGGLGLLIFYYTIGRHAKPE